MEKILKIVSKLINKYGKITVYNGLFITIILIGLCSYVKNQELIINKYISIAEKQHQEGLEYRKKINPQISNIISKLLIDTGSSSVILSELHNGEVNAANGLPFLKFTMLYEEQVPGAPSVASNYEKVNTSSYKILGTLFKSGIKMYDVDKNLQKVDSRLYFDLNNYNVKRIFLCPVYGVEKEIGFITVSYGDTTNIKNEIVFNKILIASQKAAALYNAYQK